MVEYFNLHGRIITDVKVTVLQKKKPSKGIHNIKKAELELIRK